MPELADQKLRDEQARLPGLPPGTGNVASFSPVDPDNALRRPSGAYDS